MSIYSYTLKSVIFESVILESIKINSARVDAHFQNTNIRYNKDNHFLLFYRRFSTVAHFAVSSRPMMTGTDLIGHSFPIQITKLVNFDLN